MSSLLACWLNHGRHSSIITRADGGRRRTGEPLAHHEAYDIGEWRLVALTNVLEPERAVAQRELGVQVDADPVVLVAAECLDTRLLGRFENGARRLERGNVRAWVSGVVEAFLHRCRVRGCADPRDLRGVGRRCRWKVELQILFPRQSACGRGDRASERVFPRRSRAHRSRRSSLGEWLRIREARRRTLSGSTRLR